MNICLGCMSSLDDNVHKCPHCGYEDTQQPEEEYFLEPGVIIGNRYIVGKAIGNGGFGITYVGYDLTLNRKCAIKEYYPKSLAARSSGTERVSVFTGGVSQQYTDGLNSFVSEARRLAEFTKVPEVVDVYDCILVNNTGYIIMEFINGKTVKDYLKNGTRYSFEEARELILHVLDGLIPVHKAGLIHRDISPDNIMITEEGLVKVIDFGASRQVLAEKSLNYSIILKPGYAPVEQYSTNGKQGPWTDIYAIGATMYRMITGQKPEESLDRLETDHLKRPSSLGVKITPDQEAILLKAMAVHRESRYRDAEEFQKALLSGQAPRGESVRTYTHAGTGTYTKTGGDEYSRTGADWSRQGTQTGRAQEVPQERIGGGQIAGMCVTFVAVAAVVAMLVFFGLEMGVNHRNVISEMMGKESARIEQTVPGVIDMDMETEVVRV